MQNDHNCECSVCAERFEQLQAYAQDANGNWDADCERIEKDFYAKVGRYCTFGQPAERKRQWIILFEDADRGVMVFDDEREAHTAWDRAKDNWTCTLYETSHRKFVFAAGQLRPLDELQTASRSPEASEDARSEIDVLRAEANSMSREYALASMVIGRRGDEKISLSEQIKQLRDQVERLKASLCQIFDVCENNTASESLLDQIQEIAERQSNV